MNGLSLFASAGIAELGLKKSNVKILVANELIEKRSQVHKFWHPDCQVVTGDINNSFVFDNILELSLQKKVNFIIATPPCQGFSLIGKNKSFDEMLSDQRNFLIFKVFDFIDRINPEVVIIENVPRFLKLFFPFDGEFRNIEEIIQKKYSNQYKIKVDIFNSADYGIPQSRQRAIIRMFNNQYNWEDPKKEKPITVFDAIGNLPSLESGGKSSIKNHNARKHTPAHVLFMKHTPTGKSAFENPVYFPKNETTGEKLKGYAATYKRIDWDKPAPTITMRNDCISSQSNVHPGRLLSDGTYSDARVLTLRELFILSSIDPDIDVPTFVSDIQIRNMIGESVPPLLISKIMEGLKIGKK